MPVGTTQQKDSGKSTGYGEQSTNGFSDSFGSTELGQSGPQQQIAVHPGVNREINFLVDPSLCHAK
jgi:hypothetical protein